mmetsp:Transcript_308/g.558  ORF Transcript_308/g.558 Transcript_308/m.558 type:complete len:98 (+) Transcript_308:63-356(+)
MEDAKAEKEKGPPIPVHLRSVGEADSLKKMKYKIDGQKPIFYVETFLRKQLKRDGALFLFCGSGFSPTPDQLLHYLYENFQSGGELVIHYGYQEAWG